MEILSNEFYEYVDDFLETINNKIISYKICQVIKEIYIDTLLEQNIENVSKFVIRQDLNFLIEKIQECYENFNSEIGKRTKSVKNTENICKKTHNLKDTKCIKLQQKESYQNDLRICGYIEDERYIVCPHCKETDEEFDWIEENIESGDKVRINCPYCNKEFDVWYEKEETILFFSSL
jgi:hypothetical protein